MEALRDSLFSPVPRYNPWLNGIPETNPISRLKLKLTTKSFREPDSLDGSVFRVAYEIYRRLGHVRKPKIKSTLKSGVLADPNDKIEKEDFISEPYKLGKSK